MICNQVPAVTLSEFSVDYQGRALFTRFNLQLIARKWHCLLGPSGIGKTTILRFIARLKLAKDITCSGKLITSDQQPLIGRISYLTDQDLLLLWLNILDNLFLGAYLRDEKVTKLMQEQALLLLKRTGLAGVEKLKPAQLSLGMRARVALLRIFIENREVVLLDEPFSALDTFNKFKLQNLAAEVLAGRTVLMVTHDPLTALRLSDNIYLLHGSPAKIVYTLRPIGCAPRAPDDNNLLYQQAELIKKMAKNDFI